MPRTFYNKPRLCKSGITAIMPHTLRTLNGRRMTADEGVADALEKCRTMTLEAWSHIYLWQDAQFWEFMYVSDRGARGVGTLRQKWERFTQLRVKRKGLYCISGNFTELSYAFSIETYDRAIVVEFAKAFMANPGWPAIFAYVQKNRNEFRKHYKAWGKEYVELDA